MKKKDGLTSKGKKIVKALSEFRDALTEGARIEERFTVRTVELDLTPRAMGAKEIKGLRQSMNLSQPLFARFLGVDVKTVRGWEQGLREPSGIASRFLSEMASQPEYWQTRLRQLVRARRTHLTDK